MGIADFARAHPTSFRRKCTMGQTTFISLTLTEEGIDATSSLGHVLYTLVSAGPDRHQLIGSDGEAVLSSRPSTQKGQFRVVDRNGVELANAAKQQFTVEGTSYAWRKKSGSIGGEYMYNLTEAGNGATKPTLVEIVFTSKTKGRADLTAYPAAINIPLALILFQTLVLYYKWSHLAPLKKLAFSSIWL